MFFTDHEFRIRSKILAMKQCLSYLTLSILLLQGMFAQEQYPKDYFRSPVDFPIVLSGTFGELRSNHFHSGIDIKTRGVTGHEIRAIADGYVSRIKVSAWGYGYALYISHPNGYTSVYGHLQSYNNKIASYVKDYQYKIKSFGFNHYLSKNALPVKKGEVIGLSGNTGYSFGAHLHFEIRESHTQCPLNPLLFGFEVKDNINPIIEYVKVFPLNDHTFINHSDTAIVFPVEKKSKLYTNSQYDTIEFSGEIGLGISTYDKLNYAYNHNGVYAIELFVDSVLHYKHDLDKYCFHETKYINSLIDYERYLKKRDRIQKSFIEPGNQLSIYKNVTNSGHISFNDTLFHVITYKVEDLAGNESVYSVVVKNKKRGDALASGEKNKLGISHFQHDEENYYSTDGCMVYLPANILYKDMMFCFEKHKPLENTLTPVFSIHNKFVPLHGSYSVSIQSKGLSHKLKTKAFIARLDEDGELFYEGGKWKGSYLMAKTRYFGNFAVAIDTVAPEITPVNFSDKDNVSDLEELQVKIEDDITGIRKYTPILNGKWLLMEYDGKNNMLTYKIDKRLKQGQNKFKLVVTDRRNNRSIYTAELNKK